MLKKIKAALDLVKQLGLGGLWMVLGLASSNDWVSGWLIGMSITHLLLVLLGLFEKLTPHVGGGINSTINAEAQKEGQ